MFLYSRLSGKTIYFLRVVQNLKKLYDNESIYAYCLHSTYNLLDELTFPNIGDIFVLTYQPNLGLISCILSTARL